MENVFNVIYSMHKNNSTTVNELEIKIEGAYIQSMTQGVT